MNKKILLLIILLPLTLGGCGIKERVMNLTDNSLKRDTNSGDEISDTNTELTGMLLVLEPENCPLVEGCGPRYSLLGRNLLSQVAVYGELLPEHRNLIVSVIGAAKPLSEDLVGKSGYERISAEVDIKKYRIRSSISYYPYLVDQATIYTSENFGCDLFWDKSYSWSIEENEPHLIITMTDTFSDQELKPRVRLTYNGDTGNFISLNMQPEKMNPCGN